jgi:hypothetical protein
MSRTMSGVDENTWRALDSASGSLASFWFPVLGAIDSKVLHNIVGEWSSLPPSSGSLLRPFRQDSSYGEWAFVAKEDKRVHLSDLLLSNSSSPLEVVLQGGTASEEMEEGSFSLSVGMNILYFFYHRGCSSFSTSPA